LGHARMNLAGPDIDSGQGGVGGGGREGGPGGRGGWLTYTFERPNRARKYQPDTSDLMVKAAEPYDDCVRRPGDGGGHMGGSFYVWVLTMKSGALGIGERISYFHKSNGNTVLLIVETDSIRTDLNAA
jgi:hypothetical protein